MISINMIAALSSIHAKIQTTVTRCFICSDSYINHYRFHISHCYKCPRYNAHAVFIHTYRQKEKRRSFCLYFHPPTIAINKFLASFSPHTALISTLLSSVLLCLAPSIFRSSPCYLISPFTSSAFSHYFVFIFCL